MASRAGKSGVEATLQRMVFAISLLASGAFVMSQSAQPVRDGLSGFRLAAADMLSSRGGPTMWTRLTRQGEKDARIAELERQVQELSRWRQAALTMAYRMEAYEELLAVMGEPPEKGVTARVVAEIDGPFAQTRLANAGQDQGVSDGAVALNESGLVGRVVDRGRRSSRILLVTDYNSRVPVVGEVSGARAIMYGDRSGDGELSDLPESDGFRVGERILTSGEGGLFPQGLLVGRAYQNGRNWRVSLAMRQGSPDYVRLIPPAIIPRPEDDPVIEPDPAETGDETGLQASGEAAIGSPAPAPVESGGAR